MQCTVKLNMLQFNAITDHKSGCIKVLIFFTARSAGRIVRYLPNIFISIPFTIILNTDSGFGIAETKQNNQLKCVLLKCVERQFKHTSYPIVLA